MNELYLSFLYRGRATVKNYYTGNGNDYFISLISL